MRKHFDEGNASRNAFGQGLIEALIFSLVTVTVFVLIIMLALNVYATTVNSEKLKFVANTAAETYTDAHYFLGMVRPNCDDTQAQQKARRVVDLLLNQLGLPPASSVAFQGFANNNIAESKVTLTVGGIRLPFARNGIFPSILGITVKGQAAQVVIKPYASFVIGLPCEPLVLPGKPPRTIPRWLAVSVPAYGYDVRFNKGNNPLALFPAPMGERGPIVGPCTIVASDGNFQGAPDTRLWELKTRSDGTPSVVRTVSY